MVGRESGKRVAFLDYSHKSAILFVNGFHILVYGGSDNFSVCVIFRLADKLLVCACLVVVGHDTENGISDDLGVTARYLVVSIVLTVNLTADDS